MDAVYVCREGENPELMYSLRTLKNVLHGNVWIFGGTPSWVNPETVQYRHRIQGGSPYGSSRGNLAAACNTPEVSDPFMLWNDDFFAMHPIGPLPTYHRGPLAAMLEQFATVKTPWAKGLRETAAVMEKHGLLANAKSYDAHLPLPIYKTPMREAMRLAKQVRVDAVHLRTLYGAVAGDLLHGVPHIDPKLKKRTDPFPLGAWLSSGDDTFRSTVEPVLRYLFPDKSPYEKE